MDFTPFPTALLPCPLRDIVVEGAQAIGVDEAFVAVPLLAAAASAIGTSRQIRLKATWAEPPVLWVALVAPSGTVKSAPLELAMSWVRRRQNALIDADRKARKSSLADDFAFKMPEYIVCGKKRPPPMEHVYAACATVEALANRLLISPRGLIVATDDLAAWLASFGRCSGSRGADIAHWLAMHRAGPLRIDRKQRRKPTLWIERAAVCVSGGIQPRVLRRLLRPELFDNGLAARLLLAMPPMKKRVWTETELTPARTTAVGHLFDSLYALEPDTDSLGKPAPRDVLLDKAAREAWVTFFNEHNRQQQELGDPALAATWSKLEAYAARFALVIHCCRAAVKDGACAEPSRGAQPLLLDAASLQAGVTLARWFGGEAARVYQEIASDPGERAEEELVELISRLGGEITERQLRRSPRAFRTAGAATAALESLVSEGLGKWVYPGPGADGGRAARRFQLTCSFIPGGDKTPDIDSASGGFVATIS